MCFSSQQPKPDINKPAYKPNQMRDHFKFTMGGSGSKKSQRDEEAAKKAPVVVPKAPFGATN